MVRSPLVSAIERSGSLITAFGASFTSVIVKLTVAVLVKKSFEPSVVPLSRSV